MAESEAQKTVNDIVKELAQTSQHWGFSFDPAGNRMPRLTRFPVETVLAALSQVPDCVAGLSFHGLQEESVDAVVRCLASLPKLVSLELEEDTQLTPQSWGKLAKAWPETLSYLKLHNNPMVDDRCLAAIPLPPALTYLVVSKCSLTDASVPVLIERIPSTLTNIHVYDNMLTDAGKAQLHEGLSGHKNITQFFPDAEMYRTENDFHRDNEAIAKDLIDKTERAILSFADLREARERVPAMIDLMALKKESAFIERLVTAGKPYSMAFDLPPQYPYAQKMQPVAPESLPYPSFEALQQADGVHAAFCAGQGPQIFALMRDEGVKITPDWLLNAPGKDKPRLLDVLEVQGHLPSLFTPENWVGNLKAMTTVRDQVPPDVLAKQVPDMRARVNRATALTMAQGRNKGQGR